MVSEKKDVEELLKGGMEVQLYPQGWSMYPLIYPGRDQVRIEPVKGRKLRRGQVVLFRRSKPEPVDGREPEKEERGILVLHRIWRAKDRQIFLVGDNQKIIEGPVGQEQVIGIMSAVIRKGKNLSVHSLGYQMYSRVWLRLRPLRPLLSKMAAAVRKCVGKHS